MTTPHYDRLIVHKFDPLTPAPGGIDTCIRGILKYATNAGTISVVGVDGSGGSAPGRVLGEWETHNLGGQDFAFLPVANLDPGNQVRRVPHAVTIARGLLRFRSRIAPPTVVQSHRADLGLVVSRLWRTSSHTYFIHTQESGLLGNNSDSFWRRAGSVHRAIERAVVRSADSVRIFNPTYATVVAQWTANARFSPTWWDPALVLPHEGSAQKARVLWAGRLEQPKNPFLALDTLGELTRIDPDTPWTLRLVGTGNLRGEVAQRAEAAGLGDALELAGRLSPSGVMAAMSTSDVFLMTSVPGYEGYPRVLVEALASGLAAVVTTGSDTGGLVDGSNGFAVEEDASQLAAAIVRARAIGSSAATSSVSHLSAPVVIERLYESD